MDFFNSTSIPLQEDPALAVAESRLLTNVIIPILFSFTVLYVSAPGPGRLEKHPIVCRSTVVDAFRSGLWWRLFLPRLLVYTQEAYNKYTKDGIPFRLWFPTFRHWVYILPPKYMPQVKNRSLSELSFEAIMVECLGDQFLSGGLDKLDPHAGSKLLNGNLRGIRPLIQERTEDVITSEIGEFTRSNARKVALEFSKRVSSQVVFGEALAKDNVLLEAAGQYAKNFLPYALALRYVNLGPLRDAIMYLLRRKHRRNLSIVTQHITNHILERSRVHYDNDKEKPYDCIQWAMDQNKLGTKTPETIAQELLLLWATMTETPVAGLVNLLYDVASNPECLDELRAEIEQCLAEHQGEWCQDALAKMKKLDSFILESLRLRPGLFPFTGWRMVTSNNFRFDDGFVLPKGAVFAFPTIHMQHDPDLHPDGERFDPFRFYCRAEEGKNDTGTEWQAFGFGRQACPGRFYGIRLWKTVIGKILLRYDVQYAGGHRPRPQTLDLEPFIVPDYSVDLDFTIRTSI